MKEPLDEPLVNVEDGVLGRRGEGGGAGHQQEQAGNLGGREGEESGSKYTQRFGGLSEMSV